MDQIATPGWYTAKPFEEGFPEECLFRYIAEKGAIGEVRQEAKFDESWPKFVSKKIHADGTPPEMLLLAKDRTPEEILALSGNDAFMHFLLERERSYWKDWGAIYKADEAFRVEFGALTLRSDLTDVEAYLTRWANPGSAKPGA